MTNFGANDAERRIVEAQLQLAKSQQPSDIFAGKQQAARQELDRLERVGVERPYQRSR